MIKAIFFDFDGVIVESVDIKTCAFTKLFEPEGELIAKKVRDYHLKNTGVSRFDKFRYIYKEILCRPLNEDEFKKLCDKFAGLVMDEVVKALYVKGAIEFLNAYGPKHGCYLLSATPQGEIEEILRRRSIDKFFKAVYGAPFKKTDAVKEILHKERLKPSEALYVGDAMSDYIAARDNSVYFIARINNNEAIFKGIDCPKIKDLTKLPSMIEEQRNARAKR